MTVNAPPPPELALTPVALRSPSARAVELRLRQTIRSLGPRLGPLVVAKRMGRAVPDAQLASETRRAFGRLGATYTKLGQVVASAPGVFGPEIADEFRSLLDDGRPVPFGRIRAVIESETGRPLDESFARIDPTPIGCASIAVVHRAVLPDGRDVAVKVTRPGIRRKVSADLAIMSRILPLLAGRIAGGDSRLVKPMLEGLREQLSEELDLRNEARTMSHFAKMIADAGLTNIVIPATVSELSGQRVLVMEFLDGVPIDDVEAVRSFGFDPTPIVEAVVKAWFLTTLRDGVFHGDVHAGNLMLLADGRVGILDWGILGRLSDETRHEFRDMIAAALGDDAAWVRVTDRVTEQFGPMLADRLGISPEQIPTFVRGLVEPLLTRPFGEVQLSALFMGPDSTAAGGAGFVGTGSRHEPIEFDRGMFLLVKQLLYFERYGKLYLSEVSLLSDRAFFEAIIATPDEV